MRRLDQQLAAEAARVVPAVVSDEVKRRFAGLPAMIMTSGISATGAFLLARDYKLAATAILEDAARHAGIKIGDTTEGTLSNIAKEPDGRRYLIAEARARVFALWLARIAAARHVKTPGKSMSADEGGE